MGMPYPGGIHLDKAAEGGNPHAFSFPHPHVDGNPLDFSFSGLKTAALNLLHNAAQKGETLDTADLSAAFRETVVDILCSHFLQAAEQTGARTLVLAGRGIRQLPAARPHGDGMRRARVYAVPPAAVAVRRQRRDGRRTGLL